jgi:hypothetical protein
MLDPNEPIRVFPRVHRFRDCSTFRFRASLGMPVAQLSHQNGEYATCEQKPAKMSEGVRYRENGCLATGCSREDLKSLQMYARRVCVGVDNMTEDCCNGRLVSIRIEAGIG